MKAGSLAIFFSALAASVSAQSCNADTPAPVLAQSATSTSTSTSTSAAVKPTQTSAAVPGGASGQASTTRYSDGQMGACGCGDSSGTMFSWQTGISPTFFTAAGSSPIFGSGTWCGSGCGKCYQLTNTGQTPTGGDPGPDGAVVNVMVTNLCPAQGNEQWCSTPNQYGMDAHFDIMGGVPGWDNPIVTYEEIPCPGSGNSLFSQCRCASGGS